MLLLAAGRGRRFAAERPKVYLPCAGRSLLLRSAQRLARITEDREIILAVHPEDRAELLEPLLPELQAAGVTHVVDGGATRQESMLRALESSDPRYSLVLIHDAARPFAPIDASREAIARAEATGAACLGIPAPDTLKRVDERRIILETVDRQRIWLAQTPQVVKRALLLQALEHAQRVGFEGTDDVSMLEQVGIPVEVVLGSAWNIKITTAQDMSLGACIARAEDSE